MGQLVIKHSEVEWDYVVRLSATGVIVKYQIVCKNEILDSDKIDDVEFTFDMLRNGYWVIVPASQIEDWMTR